MQGKTAEQKMKKQRTINLVIGGVLMLMAIVAIAGNLGLIESTEPQAESTSPVGMWIAVLLFLAGGIYFVRKPVQLANYRDDTPEEVAAKIAADEKKRADKQAAQEQRLKALQLKKRD